MSKIPVLAAMSAALLALAVPAYGTNGVTQVIRDDQYSRFVSGASFCADTSEVWTNAHETWSASGGLDPRYWSGISGAAVASTGGHAPDGSHYYTSLGFWRHQEQPPVYGLVDTNAAYSSLYQHQYTHASYPYLVDIDTTADVPVVCRFAEKGDVVASDGGDIFFDANVTLEAFAYGEANRPDDGILAPDAKIALYLQDTKPGGDPRLFVVARDWNTGVVRHHRVSGAYDYLQNNKVASDPYRYSGRIIVRAVRSVHKGKSDPVVPAFLVYLTDGRSPCTWDVSGNPPVSGEVQWDKVRDDLGGLSTQYANPLFRPLSMAGDMRLSRVSYGGGMRLGTYAVGTADPMRTTVSWAADSSMIRLLRVDGTDIDGMRWTGSGYQYQGTEDVDAGAYTYYRTLFHNHALDVPGSISWRGVNGWSDGSYTVTPGGGCEVTLGPGCFPKGRASLDSMAVEEDVADELAQQLPVCTGERIGNRYVEVSDALAHAAVLGGTVTLLAYPMDALVITQLAASVTIDLTEHYVPYEWNYQKALDLPDPSCAGVIANLRPGVASVPTLTLLGGTITGDATEYGGMVFGGLRTTGVSVDVRGMYFTEDSCICDAPHATVYGRFDGDLYVTNSVLSISDGMYGESDGGYTGLHVSGGSLHISGGDFAVLSAGDTTSGTISGGTFGTFSYAGGGHIVWDDTAVSIAGVGVRISGGTFCCRLEGSGIPVSGGLFLVTANPDIATSGVVSLAPGKKFARTRTQVPPGQGEAFEFWEVRDDE